jgi:UDP-glucose 4-epimerase
VESIGTFHVLNTLAATKIPHFVVFSGTFVYGARAKNPNFIKENRPLSKSGSPFVRLRAEVEQQIQEFAHDYPKTVVTTLRFAPILGPNSTDVRAQYFLKEVVPKILGFDPLVQFIHEDDALHAVQCVLTQYESKKDQLRGAFNIVGRGVFPLTTGIHISGKIAFSIPTFLCEKLFALGYRLRLWDLPREMVPFYKFLCVADGTKAKKILGFEARYSSRQALKAVVETHKVHFLGFAQDAEAAKVLGEEKNFTTNFKRIF